MFGISLRQLNEHNYCVLVGGAAVYGERAAVRRVLRTGTQQCDAAMVAVRRMRVLLNKILGSHECWKSCGDRVVGLLL